MNEIGFEIVECCPLCGSAGDLKYDQLEDRVYSASGIWQVSKCRSPECRLLWLSKRPKPSEISKAYQSYYTHEEGGPGQLGERVVIKKLYHNFRNAYMAHALGYARKRSFFLASFFKAAAHLHPCGPDSMRLEAMCLKAPDQPARLLEVGCGNGYLLRRMQSLGWEVEGLDFDPQCLRHVHSAGIPCKLGDLREQHYPDQSFDALYMGNVIEHVYDPAGFLEECARILKPGGRLVVITPNAESLGHHFYQADWRGLEPPRHLQIFNLQNLTALCRKSNLAVVKMRTSIRGAWYIQGMSSTLRATRLAGEPQVTRPVKLLSIAGMARQLFSRIWVRIAPRSGEELIVVAVKK
ncbi:MAG: putative SAM-dependent methyltransferase [Chthoniobacteraceae bacterium]|nr:putative SAM-dependent methyltransferase [Chthoniobacteraceae bacterium]